MTTPSSTTSSRTRALTIAHVTDLDPSDAPAFDHALAFALASQSALVSIHANDDPSVVERLPAAHRVLARWGKLSAAAGPGDEAALGMRHSRLVENCCDDVVDTLLTVLARIQPDLLVAATSARDTARRVLAGSVAEPLARQVAAPTLLLPAGTQGFVSADHGTLSLSRILVAAGDAAATEVGLTRALWLADVAGAGALEVELCHVGAGALPAVPPSVARADTLVRAHRIEQGSLEEALAERAETCPAELIVMATRGHDSLRDFLLGSHAERTLHRASCPVLSVPLV
jgi:nucleotide-binding universal stress UspA family protein